MALPPDKIPALAAELAADPAGLGYAAFAAAGRHGDIERAINAASGPGAGPVVAASVPKASFLKALLPAALALATDAKAALRDKYDRILAIVCASDPIAIDATNLAMLQTVVNDGLLSMPQAQAIYTRQGSRCEAALGVGLYADSADVAAALALNAGAN